jgi:hypothetical protein
MRFADLECRYERPGHCLHCIPAMRDALRGFGVPLRAAGALWSSVGGAELDSSAVHVRIMSRANALLMIDQGLRTKDYGPRTKDAAQPQTKDAMGCEKKCHDPQSTIHDPRSTISEKNFHRR